MVHPRCTNKIQVFTIKLCLPPIRRCINKNFVVSEYTAAVKLKLIFLLNKGNRGVVMLEVRISPGLKAYKKHGQKVFLQWDGGKVKEVLNELDIDPGDVFVLVDNKNIDLDDEITDNKVIEILPLLAGG